MADLVKTGDIIEFFTCCNADRKKLKGEVSYKEQLGFIVVVDDVTYEVRKLVDIEIIKEA